MQPTYVLSLDFGTAYLRMHRAEINGMEITPKAAPLKGMVVHALPTVLELAQDSEEIQTYGLDALNSLREGDSARCVQEFKRCLTPLEHELPSVSRSAGRGSSLCAECGRMVSSLSRFCPECGLARSDTSMPPGSARCRYEPDTAFGWAEQLFTKIVLDMKTRLRWQVDNPSAYRIVASVPVSWNETTRERYQAILVRCFGNKQITLITEAEAALCYHAWKRELQSGQSLRSALVLNFGAGALEATLGRVVFQGSQIRLAEPRSYREGWGSGDFDVAVAVYIAEKLGLSLQDRLPIALRQQGRLLKEQYALAITNRQNEVVRNVVLPVLSGDSHVGTVTLNRSLFESNTVAGPLVREFDRFLARMLTAFEVTAESIKPIFITGGGADWYFVREALERRFPQTARIGEEAAAILSKGLTVAPIYLAPPAPQQDDPAREAYALLLRDQNEAALGIAGEALQREPNHALAHAVMGYACLRLQKLPEAARELKAAIAVDPSQSLAHAGLGGLLRGQQRYTEAEREYSLAIQFDPNSLLAHFGLGMVYQDQQKLKEAEQAYRRALALVPDYLRALRQIGKLFLDSRRYEDAYQAFRKVLKQAPQDAMACFHLGQIYAAQREEEKAAAYFERSAALNPNFAPVHLALGALNQSRQLYDKAEQAYRQAILIDSRQTEPLYKLGMLYQEQNRFAEAIPIYRQILALAPNDIEAYRNLGISYANIPNYPEAEQAFRRVIALKPDQAAAYYDLGKLFHRWARAAMSQREYETAKTCYAAANEQYQQTTRVDSGFSKAWEKQERVRKELLALPAKCR